MRHDKQAGDLVRAIATKPSSSFVNTRWEIKVNVCYDRLWKRNDSDGAWLIFSSTDIVSLDSFLQTTKYLGTVIYFCTAFTMKSFRSVQLSLTFLIVGCCLSVYARPDHLSREKPQHQVGSQKWCRRWWPVRSRIQRIHDNGCWRGYFKNWAAWRVQRFSDGRKNHGLSERRQGKKIIWTVVESVLTFLMTRIVTLSFWIRGLWPTQTTISKSTSKLFGRRRPIT